MLLIHLINKQNNKMIDDDGEIKCWNNGFIKIFKQFLENPWNAIN